MSLASQIRGAHPIRWIGEHLRRRRTAGPEGPVPTGWFEPDVDVEETRDAFVFTADLPGVPANDIEVSMADGELSISGARIAEREERGETFYVCERDYGSFRRGFTLPADADTRRAHAWLDRGVLRVVVPRNGVRPRRIAVRG